LTQEGHGGRDTVGDAMGEKPFKLEWSSRDETLTLEGGDYNTIPEAADAQPGAEDRLRAKYPDVEGTWRVVPNT
jgi:hypothetical protein